MLLVADIPWKDTMPPMRPESSFWRTCVAAAVLSVVLTSGKTAGAWDYEVHRIVNQLALASLPTNFPSFIQVSENRERVAFLAGEPDRWRNSTTADLPLRHLNGPDHYIDIEELENYGLKLENLNSLRYEYVGKLGAIRATNANVFPEYDSTKDPDKVKLLVGLLPWTITENYLKMKSGFSYLKAYEEAGTPAEITNAQQNIIYVMGVMGHYVGDASQPLHTTKHYNGWAGSNPNGYTTNKTFHSWIDGGYLGKVGVDLDALTKQLRPARPLWPENLRGRKKTIFEINVEYIGEQFKRVETLYELDKDGRLSAKGTKGMEGKEFLNQQLIIAGQMLGDLWLTAWQQAPPDGFLKGQLNRRKTGGVKPASE